MALPTEATLRASRFPATADHAAAIFATVSPDQPLPARQLELLSVLLSSAHGARGLFVALLSDPSIAAADANPLDAGLVRALVEARAAATPPSPSNSPDPGSPQQKQADDTNANANASDGRNEEGVVQTRYVREIAVKNTVMSAAMVVRYGADAKDELRAASASTCERAKRVLAAWDRAEGDDVGGGVSEVARQMYESVTSGGEVFDPFVKKWEYDAEQREAMAEALRDVFPDLPVGGGR